MIDDDKDSRSNETNVPFEEASNPAPASEYERQQILDTIREPEHTLEYTPEGTVVQEVNTELSDAQNRRLREITDRLENARKRKQMDRNFDRNR